MEALIMEKSMVDLENGLSTSLCERAVRGRRLSDKYL